MADGTEYELRDTIYDGAPLMSPTGCGIPTQSRGNTFVSADGTSVTFISETPIDEQFTYSRSLFGYLMLRDGTRYRIDNGLVSWMRDRNGNKLEFWYTNDRVTLIKDSLNRQITVEYNINDTSPYGLCDKITFNGFGGQARVIRVSYAPLSTVLAAGFSLQSKNQLFPQQSPDWVNDTPGMTSNFDTQVISAVWLPDGGTSRRYRFFYNSYGELARAELPTGGAYEYEWEASPFMSYEDAPQEILRRVKERRVYNGSTLELKTTYTFDLPGFRTGNTTVVVDNFDGQASPQRINRERHSFYGTPIPTPYRPIQDLYIDSAWTQGKEFQTEWLAADAVTVLKRTTQTWRQRTTVSWWTCSGCTQANAPVKDPRLVEIITILPETNQISKRTSIDPTDPSGQTVGFDQFNNETEAWEYDYGIGGPGAFVRRTHTDYVVTGIYVNANTNPALGAHLRALPSQRWVSSDVGGTNKTSLITYEYDNYANDTRHKPLVSRTSITGHDATYSSSFTVRGNLTGITSYTNAPSATGPVTQSLQYDIAGNVVASVDGLAKVATHTYGDSFCNGSTCGGSFTANTYAFMTEVTSPIPDPTGQHGSTAAFATTQIYDFWTGNVTSRTDPNNQTTTFEYNDALDRQTAVLRPSGGGRTDFEYGDTAGALFVRTLSDLDTTRRTESYQYFDGLGRVIESRTYENSGQYIVVKQVPFVMQQDPDSGLWFASNKTSNPFRPYLGEQPVWTTVFLDALGRTIKVRTP
ncbi:MAG TPA: RHS repeat domain-containing protein, partial [Anaerolineales bacterium]|nr:RHS repeat domain-containing protein [Anaerolineales bacterium]